MLFKCAVALLSLSVCIRVPPEEHVYVAVYIYVCSCALITYIYDQLQDTGLCTIGAGFIILNPQGRRSGRKRAIVALLHEAMLLHVNEVSWQICNNDVSVETSECGHILLSPFSTAWNLCYSRGLSLQKASTQFSQAHPQYSCFSLVQNQLIWGFICI